jgi:alanyl-tRNA synthetase
MSVSSNHLRSTFLQYFAKHNHFVEKSAPLIPQDDPTLLFVNAGMVQFKNVFTQKETRPYKAATTSQKCVRAGGKHNDLENVGNTARHHTFFEMLGNFSFGDYFKEKAITLAWDYLVGELGLPKDKIKVSIFAGDDKIPADEEAFNIWHKIVGIPSDRIMRLGRADNFWQMGETGPCGPCTEIHIDRSDVNIGFGAQGDDEKIIEVWNLVFMQYEQLANGSLIPLPAPCVDTGMGLERLAAVVNRLGSNYDTDLFRPLIERTAQLSGKKYSASDSKDDVAMRVIADHSRATAFLIADGLTPGNDGRGYVLRRFMRRAIRQGAQLGLKKPFLSDVCLQVVREMCPIYPELSAAQSLIEKVVHLEEETFRKTLDRGLALFYGQTSHLKSGDLLDGTVVFRLHETYGFPPDLTEVLAQEEGLNIDWETFSKEKKAHEEKSGSGLGLKGVDSLYIELANNLGKTQFIEAKEADKLHVKAIINMDVLAERIGTKEEGFLVLDQTPFYGESGGQVGDTGVLVGPTGRARVLDTKKVQGLNLHKIYVEEGFFTKDQSLTGTVDWARRQDIMRNHSATHLLHSALREVLGTHVSQKGSLVAPDRLRFDFAHFAPLSEEETSRVEGLVNDWILANEQAKVQVMGMEEARAYGALALFGEKYEAKVRVLDMGSHSTELCGGTHCHRTGDIGGFRIIQEAPLAQGIRRVEAITGQGMVLHSRESDRLLKLLGKTLQVSPAQLPERIEQILATAKGHEQSRKSSAASGLKERAAKAVQAAKKIGSTLLVCELLEWDDGLDLKQYADFVRDHLGSGVVVVGTKSADNKCILLVAITKDLEKKFHAGKLVEKLAAVVGGKGGGRPDLAQAGGPMTEKLAEALAMAEKLVSEVA